MQLHLIGIGDQRREESSWNLRILAGREQTNFDGQAEDDRFGKRTHSHWQRAVGELGRICKTEASYRQRCRKNSEPRDRCPDFFGWLWRAQRSNGEVNLRLSINWMCICARYCFTT